MLPLAPDRLHKDNVSGGPPYGIVLADGCVDGPGVVAEANLEGHATLEDPSPWFRRLDASDDALEHHASPQPVQADPALGGCDERSMFQRGAQRLRGLVDHGVSAR